YNAQPARVIVGSAYLKKSQAARGLVYPSSKVQTLVNSVGGGSTFGPGRAAGVNTGLPHRIITIYAGSGMTRILGESANTRKSHSFCGVNANSHAVEALYVRNTNPIIDLLALDGTKSLAESLSRIVKDSQDIAAHSSAQLQLKRGLEVFGYCEKGIDKATAIAFEKPYWNPRTIEKDAHLRIDPSLRRRPGNLWLASDTSSHESDALRLSSGRNHSWHPAEIARENGTLHVLSLYKVEALRRSQAELIIGIMLRSSYSRHEKKTIENYQESFHWAETQKDGAIPSFATRKNDPYQYQSGFGIPSLRKQYPGLCLRGRTIPDVLVWDYTPKRNQTDLPDENDVENTFLPINPRVHVSPTQLAWLPFDIPTEPTTFGEGLHTIAGSGEPTLREGIATHIYLANKSMINEAFVNSDGDFLIVPQQGNLDIQTEFGMIFVQPGEICVVQRPLGGNGLFNPRDFLHPVAKYNTDLTGTWKIRYKVCGKLFQCTQDHCPYDVVAWHGNYVPYKYDLTKFVNVGSISVDHIDTSIFCVLTAKSRDPTALLADFLIFPPRWDVASSTYRPPYYHRNIASELMGLIYSEYSGRSANFLPGGISYECSMVPHGVAYEEYKAATEAAPPVTRINEGSIAFMFESSRAFTIADYAWKSAKKHEHDPEMWDKLADNFSEHGLR
ncbi:hypothetical protein KEM54_000362, partial [Ascosphaera aggregata]